ncbi:uncharacterized protein LOC135360752 [Latimeria chalumnae]|uniref:uncharacterized protein LOC135360752 n=1 Tax=Latimeria chalumnae TaxID=7897 RepID=UPI00313D0944
MMCSHSESRSCKHCLLIIIVLIFIIVGLIIVMVLGTLKQWHCEKQQEENNETCPAEKNSLKEKLAGLRSENSGLRDKVQQQSMLNVTMQECKQNLTEISQQLDKYKQYHVEAAEWQKKADGARQQCEDQKKALEQEKEKCVNATNKEQQKQGDESGCLESRPSCIAIWITIAISVFFHCT